MRIFAKIGLHFVLICLVTLTPPLRYVFQMQKDPAEAYGPSNAMEIVCRVWAHVQPRIARSAWQLAESGAASHRIAPVGFAAAGGRPFFLSRPG
ncbi:hypothetical protein PP715_03905 [Ralstonia solanacearum]|nr:hypothetical protein [Ralstonia solanacearum]MCL9826008.1 hypothetical protein [Ralstonia solanacearum]MCL9830996.1 hypothetical protein [Ralstonia solanacearum]MCL9835777.1 hypothetical protein [Ralstonia solanacearum]MCL9840329.1 hypothetical protein [Ralstonia solanacearum]